VSQTLTAAPSEQPVPNFQDRAVQELCELAALICTAPVAAVQLIVGEGLSLTAWFGPPPAERSIAKTPCALVIASGEALAIEDLHVSPQPDGSPWDLGELRSYLGVPILAESGVPLGTVCVFDAAVRQFDAAQVRALELLTQQVARNLELVSQKHEASAAASERASAIAELDRVEQRFHALVESSPLAVFALDPNAEPVFVSEGCAVLFGTAENRYEKTGWIPAVHEADRARATTQWATAVSEQSSLDTQYRIYNAEGRVQELVVCAAAVHSRAGGFEGWVGTINDVTEQAEANRDLARARRASERAREDVEARNAELQALARTKDTFLAAVSHEFRTPLTSITTFLQLLAAEDDLSDTQQEAVTVIARNTDRLNRLVSDVLNIKESPGSLETEAEEIDLREIAEDAVAAAALRAQGLGIELSVEGDSSVAAWGDPKRMAQVIDGLIDNALKFTESPGGIVVRTRLGADAAEIEVSDSGVGIAEDELERIFERFYQGAAGRESGSGSGLGLAIARRLLEAQGSRIEASSEPARGTTIRISVPTTMAPPR
jgi:PAS domain S-box-containing protein